MSVVDCPRTGPQERQHVIQLAARQGRHTHGSTGHTRFIFITTLRQSVTHVSIQLKTIIGIDAHQSIGDGIIITVNCNSVKSLAS